ncbi:hypothetical protein TNCV_946701 [Trichonephila clavipes]|nr:hypothetical protein TNCV_946701 [Trichonephila clavipes]
MSVHTRLSGREVTCPLLKPKVVDSILAAVDIFSRSENCRRAWHMIIWHVKDPSSVLGKITSRQYLACDESSKYGSDGRYWREPP